MATIYLKSANEKTVMTLRGKNLKTAPKWVLDNGWQPIKRDEFLKIREGIRNEHPLDLPEPSKSVLAGE